MELFRLFGTIGLRGVDETQNDIDQTVEHAEHGESRMTSAFKKIGTAVMTYFAVDKIVDFGKAIVDASATVSAEVSAFEQIMGDYSDNAQTKLDEIADKTGVVNTRLTGHMTSLTAKFKGLGYDIDEATTLASDGLLLASDASAFWDKSLEDSVSALNSFINGSYEGGEAIGLFANDTQLASYAIKNGIVSETKEWASLDEARKQATRLEYAKEMFAMSGATGQAAKEADQYANVQANLNEKWRQFKAEIGEPILQNIVLPAMDKLSGLVDKASAGFEKLKPIVSDLGEFWREVYEPALGAVWEALKNVTDSVIDLFSPLGDLLPKFDENKTAMDMFREASWAIEEGLYKLADNIDLIVQSIGALIVVWGSFKVGTAIQTMIQGFQTAAVQVALFSRNATGAQMAQAALNGTLKLGETIIALFTGKMTLAQLAQAGMAKAQAALNAVMSANPIALVITAIAALIAIFVVLWNQSEAFRNFWIGLWEGIKSAVSGAWEAIQKAVNTGMEFISTTISTVMEEISTAFTAAWESISSFVTTIVTTIGDFILNSFNSIKLFLDEIWMGFYTSVSELWTTIWNIVSGVLQGIGMTVSNVFESIQTTVSNVWNTIKTTTTKVWNDIKNTIKTTIENAKNIVHNTIEAIKGFFKFEWSLPHLKLPHVWISGEFSLMPPSVPSFGVDWYAKGGIFDNPTIFPTAQGLKGVGEAGAEAVTPISVLLDYVRTAVREENANNAYYIQKLIDMLSDFMPQIVEGIDRPIVLDDGTLVARLAPRIDTTLGEINKGRGRGR